MSIEKASKLGAAGLIALVIIAMAVTTYGVNKIRFGGPIHETNELMLEFGGEVSPPPVYLVEAFALANVMAIHPESFEINRIRLSQLEQEFYERANAWESSQLPDDLRAEFKVAVQSDAKEFWGVVNGKLKPAILAKNEVQVDKSLNHLLTSYRRHRKKVDGLIKTIEAEQSQLTADSENTVTVIAVILSALAVLIIGVLLAALLLLARGVLVPLAKTADTMKRMAAGDLNVSRRIDNRKDEIGTMRDAIEVFRSSLEADRERETKQKHVVETLSEGLEKLAAGDLTARITVKFDDSNEAVRQAFNASSEKLASMLSEVRQTAHGVDQGAKEIRSGSNDLSRRNSSQAASLEETSAAMAEVTKLVRKSAQNAQDVQASFSDTHIKANEGGEVVRKAVYAMASIETSSHEITQIIDVIDGIAFQTNLLALNAGVEAARAGDAGKGFAVVANEVRALAQRSADAARDIKGLIDTSTNQVDQGVGLVGEAGSLLRAIVDQIATVTRQVDEIADMAVTQANNLEQVSGSIAAMDTMTQQNAAMVEQSNAASLGLSDEATRLSQLVERFRIANHERSETARSLKPTGQVAKPGAEKSAPKPSGPRAQNVTAPARKPQTSASAPMADGNLALKAAPAAKPKAPPAQLAPKPVLASEPDDQDWSEF